MGYLTINSVSKTINELEVIKDVTLNVEQQDFLAILGPSGCGKSTLLRIIAGLEKASRGFVSLKDERLSGPGPERGMVFQKYTSFPWLTVKENIEFGLKAQKVSLNKRKQIVDAMLQNVGLQDFCNAYPSTLSGGMQQRLALARTLAVSPQILLLDEPFGALDAQTRSEMQKLILDLWCRYKFTIVFVTHDIEESIFLGKKLIMSGTRPFQIKYDYHIPFSYPRPLDIKTSSEFMQLEEKVTIKLRELVKKISV